MSGERCGYTVIDSDGDEQPCDRPAVGWRWYQDCGHEDTLDVACSWHANKAGETFAAINALVAKYRAVSPSASQQMYVRDIEIALGMDLPPVTDRDGRTEW